MALALPLELLHGATQPPTSSGGMWGASGFTENGKRDRSWSRTAAPGDALNDSTKRPSAKPVTKSFGSMRKPSLLTVARHRPAGTAAITAGLLRVPSRQ